VTEYSKSDLDREARLIAADIRKETKKPAKVKTWKVGITDGNHIFLAVIVQAHDGLRQRNVAI